jgi:LacI family transcriptional regulator
MQKQVGTGTRAPTIYDVAARAGVSHQTVTRFLSGFEGIRPTTKARVEAALKELDYRPNRAARALRTGKRKRIVVLTHALGEMGPGRVVQGAIAECRRSGYTVELIDFDGDDPTSLRDALDFVGHEPLSGLLVTAQTDVVREALSEYMTAMASRLNYQAAFTTAVGSSFAGGHIAGEYLYSLGHRNVSYLSGPQEWPVSRDRLEGLRSVFNGTDAHVVEVVAGSWAPESGYEAGRDFRIDQPSTAVFAANDQMALGFMRALHERGIDVPSDVSVMGFDDIPESKYFTPPLTTVHDDFEQEGRHSASVLIADIEGRPRPVSPEEGVTLRSRLSTAPPRAT